jgi:CRISPR-associated protein Csb2
LVICKAGFNASEQAALYRLTRIYERGHKVQCVPVSSGDLQEVCAAACRRFVSATPFIPPRHYRRGRGEFSEWLKTELRRECRNHGVQDPIDIRIISSEHGTGLSLGWTRFRMSRKQDHSTMGYGFEIAFREPIAVPIAVGYGAHFGLGQFRPLE